MRLPLTQTHVSILVLAAFAASAVLGLCAMQMGMSVGHGHILCASSGISMNVCEGNSVRQIVLTGLLAVIVLIISGAAIASWRSTPLQAQGPPVPRRYTDIAYIPIRMFQSVFSAGILQPKLLA